jgi:DNA-binding NarL/FixJ family response regulator
MVATRNVTPHPGGEGALRDAVEFILKAQGKWKKVFEAYLNGRTAKGARGVVLKASPPELLLKSIRAVAEGQHWVGSEVVADWAHISRKPGGAAGLTSREIEIISEIQAGNTNREIAVKLSISEETVKRHLSNIFGKVGVSSRLELALLASRHNLAGRAESG